MLCIIVNCYYEEEVVVCIITQSLLIYLLVATIPWVSGGRAEGSEGAHAGVSDCSYVTMQVVFWEEKNFSTVCLVIKISCYE